MTTADVTTKPLTEPQWQIAHAIAQDLVQTQTDVNELGKSIAYLRHAINQNPSEAGRHFLKYLKTLVSNGRQVGHSGRTLDYYRNIDKACSQHLKREEANAETMLQILGWTARLMRYYKVTPIGEGMNIKLPTDALQEATAPESDRQVEIKAVAQSQNFQVDQIVEAKIINIKGKEVTYEILETIKLTVKEPKKCSDLSIGEIVKVEILELRENGIPKKIRLTS